MGDAALRPAQHSEQSDVSLNPYHKYNGPDSIAANGHSIACNSPFVKQY